IRLDRDLEQGGKRLVQLESELSDARSVLAATESGTRSEHEQLAAARSRVDAALRDVERIAAEYSRIEEQHRQQTGQRTLLQTQLDESHRTREELQGRSDEIESDLATARDRSRDVAAQLATVQEELKQQQLELAKHDERLTGLRDVLSRLAADQQERVARRTQADERLRTRVDALRQARLTILSTRGELDHQFLDVERLGRGVARLAAQRRDVRNRWSAIAQQEEQLHKQRRKIQDERHNAEIRLRELRHSLATLDERIQEEYQQPLSDFVSQGFSAFRVYLAVRAPAVEIDEVVDNVDASVDEAQQALGDVSGADQSEVDSIYTAASIPFAEVRPQLEEQVNRLRRKLKLLGSVNTDALNELDDLESRFTHLSAQLQDLQEAKAALEDIIRRINKESRRIFLETFETIQGNFRILFRKVFGGGEGDIILEDPENVLECGIDIVARPPGKELRSITLLSGGEKTMTAVALLFAMFKSKPSPYCILDEVDAALDEANVDRYVNIVKEFAETTQFVVITHRKRTMTAANVLYGVTMEQAGVSKRMSVRFEDVNDDGHIRTRADAA
ncbi:MAG: chromosome segregation protein SMC, partial [Planctomycetaceae bacterium]|nr:chromosome segregation protein SMC [Planctomycetaceae bacterium]